MADNETQLTAEQQIADLKEQLAQKDAVIASSKKQMTVLRETAGMANIADLPAEVQADYASRRQAGVEASDSLSLSVGQYKLDRAALESLPEDLQEQAKALAKSARITLGEAMAHAKHALLAADVGDEKKFQHTRHSRAFKISTVKPTDKTKAKA